MLYTSSFELDYPRTLLAALHVHRIEIPYRAFPERVGPRILSLESVDYFGTTDHFSGRKKKKNNLEGLLENLDRGSIVCLASVSVWFRSKERPWNGILGFGRARNETRSTPTPFFTCAIFRAVFDSRFSFFAPKPHGNACYAG